MATPVKTHSDKIRISMTSPYKVSEPCLVPHMTYWLCLWHPAG